MKAFIKSVLPKQFFESPIYFVAIIFMLLYLISLIAQLFTYEKYLDVLKSLGLPFGDILSTLLFVLLPLLGVLSLPFLISMQVSSVLRKISKFAVILLPFLWFLVSLWLIATAKSLPNIGLLGATVKLPSGLWFTVFTTFWLADSIYIVKKLPKRRI